MLARALTNEVLNRSAIPRPNQLYVVLSLALVLFLLGLVGMWTLQARALTRELQENMDVIVELEDERTTTQLERLTSHLRAAPYTKQGSTPEFISKDEALAELGTALYEDLDDLGLNNPLLDVVTFNVGVDYLTDERLADIATEVQALPGVAGVYYQENFVERIARNAEKLSIFLLILAALFTLVAGVLIHNTVRLSLYANRFSIKTQELVGASWGFISRPFLWRSIWQGLLSGLLAVGGVAGLLYLLQLQLPELNLLYNPLLFLYGAGALVLSGVLINFLSHYVVVRRYLRLRVDELY